MALRRFADLVFDLDGTLVDSLAGIEASTRYAVQQCLPGGVVPPMRDLVGPPIAQMLMTLWPKLPAEQTERLLTTFRYHYNAEGCRRSTCYPGVAETLRLLAERKVGMFVLTNKPSAATKKILELNSIAAFFQAVVSPDSVTPSFSTKAEAAEWLRNRYGLAAEVTAVIGDGADDASAARACGWAFVFAKYGYGNGAAAAATSAICAIDSFREILSL